MCDPLTIAGAAMTGGSILANMQANSAVAKKRDKVMSAELERQKGYQRQADAVNEQSQGRYKDFKGQQDQKAQDLGDYFASQAKPLPSDAPTEAAPDSGNILVKNETAKQMGKAKAFGAQQDKALGELRAFGDVLGGISREQGVDAANIGTIGGFMRGSNAVLPLELEAANNAGSGWRTAGTLLGAGGSVATMAGLSGGWDKLSNWFEAAPSAGGIASGGASAAGTMGPVSINPTFGWGTMGPVSKAPGFGLIY